MTQLLQKIAGCAMSVLYDQRPILRQRQYRPFLALLPCALLLLQPSVGKAQPEDSTLARKVSTAELRSPIPLPTFKASPLSNAGGADRAYFPKLSEEEERAMIERLRQMENLLVELELLLGDSLKAREEAVKRATPPSASAVPASASPEESGGAWDKGGVKIIPYGIVVANVTYNSSILVPGSVAFFALPEVQLSEQRLSREQLIFSPGNTYLGLDVKGKTGIWEINGKVDFDLRGTVPVAATNIFELFFANIYLEARNDHHRFLAGQSGDVISPLMPATLNFIPLSYLPGSIGYVRPQIRYEYRTLGEDFTFGVQAAVSQAVQTLQVRDEVVGLNTEVPDGQLRLAVAHGVPDPHDPFQKKPFEFGLSGHIGERRGTLLTVPVRQEDFSSWSGNADLSVAYGKFRLEGEFFTGAILGDYAGAILQTFNPTGGNAIRAIGGWAQLQFHVDPQWLVTAGYGIDDPNNEDLATGSRSYNETLFGNVLYNITTRLRCGIEFGYWHTRWVDLDDGKVFRIEQAFLYYF